MREALPEALILGSGITVLGVLRCLAPSGVPLLVVPNGPSCCRRSRWYRKAPDYDGGEFGAFLASLDLERAVLIPCSDHWAQEVAALPQELNERFPSSLPSADVLDSFVDKARFLRLLEERDVPHPRTIEVDESFDPGELESLNQIFIKPRDSQAFHYRYGEKAFWPESREELIQKIDLVRRDRLEVILQEYIPGPTSNHCFIDGVVDKEGRIRGMLARQRLRMHPPRFGNSSYMVSVDRKEAEGAIRATEVLLGGADYRGVFSAEFKKDERDGVFKVLEVNARPWWFVEFAATCGTNFIEMAYRDALGLPIEEAMDYAVGKRLIHPYFDISACLREETTRIGGLRTFLRSLPRADRPVFRWSDPLPALCEVSVLAKKYVARRLRGRTRS